MGNLSDNPISDASEGIVKGLLNWTKEQILVIIQKIENRDLAFIQDIETINLVKEQLRTSEWDVYKRYVKDNKFRLLIQMGITLRKLDILKEFEKLNKLKEEIYFKFGGEGIHIAQFVQNGMLATFLGLTLQDMSSIAELEEQIEEIFKNIDRYVVFIREFDNKEIKIEEIKVRIYSNTPKTFIICSKKSAIPVAQEIIKKLKLLINGYTFKDYRKDENENIFLLTKHIIN